MFQGEPTLCAVAQVDVADAALELAALNKTHVLDGLVEVGVCAFSKMSLTVLAILLINYKRQTSGSFGLADTRKLYRQEWPSQLPLVKNLKFARIADERPPTKDC